MNRIVWVDWKFLGQATSSYDCLSHENTNCSGKGTGIETAPRTQNECTKSRLNLMDGKGEQEEEDDEKQAATMMTATLLFVACIPAFLEANKMIH